jgi:hypothetical protein
MVHPGHFSPARARLLLSSCVLSSHAPCMALQPLQIRVIELNRAAFMVRTATDASYDPAVKWITEDRPPPQAPFFQ